MLIRILVHSPIYFISSLARYELWFVLGMSVCVFELPSLIGGRGKLSGTVLLGIFLGLSVITCSYALQGDAVSLAMGLLACGAVFLVINGDLRKCWLAKYTMPIYLMHTIFAAGVRSILFKLGIASPIMHIALGLTASFLGPILAAEVMKHMKMDFFLFPGKYIWTK